MAVEGNIRPFPAGDPGARNKELVMPYVMVVMAGLVVAFAMVFIVL